MVLTVHLLDLGLQGRTITQTEGGLEIRWTFRRGLCDAGVESGFLGSRCGEVEGSQVDSSDQERVDSPAGPAHLTRWRNMSNT